MREMKVVCAIVENRWIKQAAMGFRELGGILVKKIDRGLFSRRWASCFKDEYGSCRRGQATGFLID